MKSLAIIKNEHRNLGAVLYTLEKLMEEAEKGKSPDFKVFHGLLTYVDRFLDRYHHPKEEDYLFPTLRHRCPQISVVLEERSQEHHDGERMLAQVSKALSAYEFLGDSELARFSDGVRGYIAFEREHAIEEERQILPLAREKLTAEDWERIDAAFAENEDPLFDDSSRTGFEELYTTITTIVPKSFGIDPGRR